MPRRSSRISSASGDTIVAPSTPPGAGLRAVVRLSGPRAVELAGARPGAIVFRAPRSYTCEDLVELHMPGSPPLVEAVVAGLVRAGARPARPGEFTLRAFLNGRIDLCQAEAVEQLIAAESDDERCAALEHLGGGLSRRVRPLEEGLLDLVADAEAAIDFADQDIEILSPAGAVARSRAALADLYDLLAHTASRGVADTRPVVVLTGRPNAGKSTLFNALTGEDAIVSSVAGTTRDVLSAEIREGVRARLLDTPGRRDTEGSESDAVRRAEEAARTADLIVFVVDVTDWEPALALEPRGRPALLVLNKCDLASPEPVRTRFHIREVVCASAKTGQGIPELKEAVRHRLAEGVPTAADARFRVNLRQQALLREAEAALDRAASVAPGLGMEFVALDLRAALEALGGITGRHAGEDLLDRIFSRFCLGK